MYNTTMASMMSQKNLDKPWYIYILQCVDGTLYTGITTDLERRVHEHNHTKKGAKYTSKRRPVKLVWHVHVQNRRIAMKEELRIKKLSRKQKLDLINKG